MGLAFRKMAAIVNIDSENGLFQHLEPQQWLI